jgi:tetratricopeptide (TPR) repeat protein
MGSGSAQQTSPADNAEPLTLTGVRLGTFETFSRLIMTFNREVPSYEITRLDVDQIKLDFGLAEAVKQGRLKLEDYIIAAVTVGKEGDHLVAVAKTKPSRFNFRAFLSSDRRAVVVDFRPEAGAVRMSGRSGVEIKLPSPETLAREFRAVLPRVPQPGTPEALLASAMDYMAADQYSQAAQVLDEFKQKYPGHRYRNPAYYLLGDNLYYMDPDHFSEHFPKVIDAYKTALGLFPESDHAPRGNLMLALAYSRMEFTNEAIKLLKQTASTYPDTIYAHIANTYLSELYLKVGKPRLAATVLDSVLAVNPKGALFRDKYFLMGQYYFKEGLFSRSTEVFREILNKYPDFYLTRPEILYYLGEGYFHLKRMALSRAFLFHSINIEPDQQDADVIMARIGDTYKEEKQAKQAIAVYALTRSLYPDSLGALVSQLRMAEFGALRELFPKERIFYELEGGVEATTMKIYEQILKTDQESPLIQLALFKLAKSYSKMEDYAEALQSLITIIKKYPKSTLLPEVRKMADQAILSEIEALFAQKKYSELIAYHQKHQDLIAEKSRPTINRYLGMAYAGLDKPQEAAKYLEASQEELATTDDPDVLFALGESFLKIGNYADAIKNLDAFWNKFPDDPRTGRTKLDVARMEYNQGLDDLALKHLEEALAQEPSLGENPENLEMLADLYKKMNVLPEYVATMEKYLEITKDDPPGAKKLFEAYSGLGEAYLSLNRKEEAAAALDKAMEIRPKDTPSDTLYVMANMYKDLGLKEKYKETLKILAESSDPFWKNAAREELSDLVPDEEVQKLLETDRE